MKFLEELGLAIGVMKIFDCIDSSAELKREQIAQVQLQNENMRLKNQIAQMQIEAREHKTIEAPAKKTLTIEDITDEN